MLLYGLLALSKRTCNKRTWRPTRGATSLTNATGNCAFFGILHHRDLNAHYEQKSGNSSQTYSGTQVCIIFLLDFVKTFSESSNYEYVILGGGVMEARVNRFVGGWEWQSHLRGVQIEVQQVQSCLQSGDSFLTRRWHENANSLGSLSVNCRGN